MNYFMQSQCFVGISRRCTISVAMEIGGSKVMKEGPGDGDDNGSTTCLLGWKHNGC